MKYLKWIGVSLPLLFVLLLLVGIFTSGRVFRLLGEWAPNQTCKCNFIESLSPNPVI